MIATAEATQIREALDNGEFEYVRHLSKLLGRQLRFPMLEGELLEVLQQMGYIANPRVIESLRGERAASYLAGDLRLLHRKLDANELWRPFPCCHDARKPSGRLALEVADAWKQFDEPTKQSWIASWPPAVVLALCCACVDGESQNAWMEIACRKFLANQ